MIGSHPFGMGYGDAFKETKLFCRWIKIVHAGDMQKAAAQKKQERKQTAQKKKIARHRSLKLLFSSLSWIWAPQHRTIASQSVKEAKLSSSFSGDMQKAAAQKKRERKQAAQKRKIARLERLLLENGLDKLEKANTRRRPRFGQPGRSVLWISIFDR